jgi:hypothetical protein
VDSVVIISVKCQPEYLWFKFKILSSSHNQLKIIELILQKYKILKWILKWFFLNFEEKYGWGDISIDVVGVWLPWQGESPDNELTANGVTMSPNLQLEKTLNWK